MHTSAYLLLLLFFSNIPVTTQLYTVSSSSCQFEIAECSFFCHMVYKIIVKTPVKCYSLLFSCIISFIRTLVRSTKVWHLAFVMSLCTGQDCGSELGLSWARVSEPRYKMAAAVSHADKPNATFTCMIFMGIRLL